MSKTVNNYIVDKQDNVFIAPDAWILVKSNQGNQKGHNRTWEIVSYSDNAEDLKKSWFSASTRPIIMKTGQRRQKNLAAETSTDTFGISSLVTNCQR